MLKQILGFCLIVAAGWIANSASPASAIKAQSAALTSMHENSLKLFLQNYLRKPLSDDDKTIRYSVAFVDLNGDGKEEAIVYITGRRWCGSGGCVTLILKRKDDSYGVVSRITITRPPIRVFAHATNGWRNLGIWVQGGGINPGYEAELCFDGNSYPRNPSISPARRLQTTEPGEVLIPSTEKGMPLYP